MPKLHTMKAYGVRV